MLENVVYLELLRRGYKVTVGKIGNLEVDFVAEKLDEKIYYQVSATIMDENTRARELRSLEAVSDNYQRSRKTHSFNYGDIRQKYFQIRYCIR